MNLTQPVDPTLNHYIETAGEPRSPEQISSIRAMIERHIGLGAAVTFAAMALSVKAASPPKTQHDINLCATTLVLEAGGELDRSGNSRRAMSAVWEIIWTRANHRRWRATPAKVVVQPLQFSCFNGITQGQAIAKAQRHPMWRHALGIVSAPPVVPVGGPLTAGADHYCTTRVNPYWTFKTVIKNGKTIRIGIEPVKIIGNHKFYRLSK